MTNKRKHLEILDITDNVRNGEEFCITSPVKHLKLCDRNICANTESHEKSSSETEANCLPEPINHECLADAGVSGSKQEVVFTRDSPHPTDILKESEPNQNNEVGNIDNQVRPSSSNTNQDEVPDLANDADFMQFVNGGWIIRKQISPQPKAAPTNLQGSSNKAQSALPLLIGDILKIIPNDEMRLNTIFGQRFSSVMFYGTCYQIKLRNAPNRPSIYRIDDGTACITVFHYITVANKNCYASCTRAMQQISMVKNAPTYRPMHQLMLLILKRAKAQIQHVANFAKVAIIGIPFRTTRNEICVRAFEIYEDNEANNDREILFKHALIEYYERDYVNYTYDNRLRQIM